MSIKKNSIEDAHTPQLVEIIFSVMIYIEVQQYKDTFRANIVSPVMV